MPILQVVVLAVVQGLTEFLPVSSTAHLYLTSWLLGWQTEALDFDIMLHVGTLVALLVYFFRDWMQIIGQAFGLRIGRDNELRLNHMLLWLLVIGTLPIGVIGFVFSKQADTVWRVRRQRAQPVFARWGMAGPILCPFQTLSTMRGRCGGFRRARRSCSAVRF